MIYAPPVTIKYNVNPHRPPPPARSAACAPPPLQPLPPCPATHPQPSTFLHHCLHHPLPPPSLKDKITAATSQPPNTNKTSTSAHTGDPMAILNTHARTHKYTYTHTRSQMRVHINAHVHLHTLNAHSLTNTHRLSAAHRRLITSGITELIFYCFFSHVNM